MYKEKYQGKLFYNFENNRIGIRFNDGTVDEGLHCGQTMDIFINGKWIPTRIEMARDWYLVDVKNLDSLVGLTVKNIKENF